MFAPTFVHMLSGFVSWACPHPLPDRLAVTWDGSLTLGHGDVLVGQQYHVTALAMEAIMCFNSFFHDEWRVWEEDTLIPSVK